MKTTTGGNNRNLTKNGNTHSNIHQRIKRYRGKACEQKCVDCSNQANEWSHRHNTDKTDIYNYYPRCYTCHDRYDSYKKGAK